MMMVNIKSAVCNYDLRLEVKEVKKSYNAVDISLLLLLRCCCMLVMVILLVGTSTLEERSGPSTRHHHLKQFMAVSVPSNKASSSTCININRIY